jgi:serine/threonine-protein kinase HipA
MKFSQTRSLKVWRTLSNGTQCQVGTLAQNQQGVFFQYHDDYLTQFVNLSPFALHFDSSLQAAPLSPHKGLHGVFADSLPDGWGLLLMDRVFRQAGILPAQLTAMDRLAFVADRGMGALSYQPPSDLQPQASQTSVRISKLGLAAQALFDGQVVEVLTELANAGSSGGARPKAQLYLADPKVDYCSTIPYTGSNAFLVKFTSSQLPLEHEEGLCEAVYLTLAKQAGIAVPDWHLLNAPQALSGKNAKQWLALERFDITPQGGRLHLHSACGLLDADFRMPGLDYIDLIKASSLLTNSPDAGQAQFRRAVFNLFALNQDDHSKNWAFLQNDKGDWQLAPFYDVTFSPGPYGEHATAFAGFGKTPPLKAMQKLAAQASFADWTQAKAVISEVVEVIAGFGRVARQLAVSQQSIRLIEQQIKAVRQANQVLLS